VNLARKAPTSYHRPILILFSLIIISSLSSIFIFSVFRKKTGVGSDGAHRPVALSIQQHSDDSIAIDYLDQ
jgi:hypothetical protein